MRERPMLPLVFSVAILVGAIVAAGVPAQGQTPKRGGILNSVLFEDPPGLMAHESSTVSNVWPVSPCYSNLVYFHPLKPLDSAETVIPELAERWSWQGPDMAPHTPRRSEAPRLSRGAPRRRGSFRL